MYLLDTNVLSELPRKKPDARVVEWMGQQEQIAISAITIEELEYGVRRAEGSVRGRLQVWFGKLLELSPFVIPVDEKIALAAGSLRASRESNGRPVAQADMLIAATAVTTGRILVTRNTRDFESCGVALFNPFSD